MGGAARWPLTTHTPGLSSVWILVSGACTSTDTNKTFRFGFAQTVARSPDLNEGSTHVSTSNRGNQCRMQAIGRQSLGVHDLLTASVRGDLSTVKRIFRRKRSACLNVHGSDGCTPTLLACKHGEPGPMDPASAHSHCPFYMTAVCARHPALCACWGRSPILTWRPIVAGHFELVKFLFTCGAQHTDRDRDPKVGPCLPVPLHENHTLTHAASASPGVRPFLVCITVLLKRWIKRVVVARQPPCATGCLCLNHVSVDVERLKTRLLTR